jgi:hypothetical protein
VKYPRNRPWRPVGRALLPRNSILLLLVLISVNPRGWRRTRGVNTCRVCVAARTRKAATPAPQVAGVRHPFSPPVCHASPPHAPSPLAEGIIMSVCLANSLPRFHACITFPPEEQMNVSYFSLPGAFKGNTTEHENVV